MIHGYDIANVNGPDFVAPGDAEFLIAKVSQDARFVDRQFDGHRQDARARGIPFGGYHYGDPSEMPDAYESCDRFIDLLGDQEYGEFAALDAEQDFGMGGYRPGDPHNQRWTIEWGSRFYTKKGYKAKLYISLAGLHDFNLIVPEIPDVFDLWYAWWPFSGEPDNPPPAPAPFYEYRLWQYNADGIDKDVWLGTQDELRATGKQNAPQPISYEALYWTPIQNLIDEMRAGDLYPHADAAFHATVSNAITLHKISLGLEMPD